MDHVDCACTACRVRIAMELLKVIPLTADQYLSILETGEFIS